MSTAVKDRAKPVVSTATQLIGAFTSKPPTRRQRIKDKTKKFGLPVLILSSMGAVGAFMRKRMQDDSQGSTK